MSPVQEKLDGLHKVAFDTTCNELFLKRQITTWVIDGNEAIVITISNEKLLAFFTPHGEFLKRGI